MNKRKTGDIAEAHATKHLTSQGYKIIKRNYHARIGEIDIIAIDTVANELVFIEVKARTSSIFGQPQESVTQKKRQRMLLAALHFVNSATQKPYLSWRFDVIALKLFSTFEIREINHIKNIFDG